MGSHHSRFCSTLITITISIGLAACGGIDLPKTQNGLDHLYENQEVGYSFAVPTGFAHETDDAEGMYFGYAETSVFGHTAVQSYDTALPTCTSSLTGVQKPIALEKINSKTEWGKVTFWDDFIGEGFEGPSPVCSPPFPQNGREYVPCEAVEHPLDMPVDWVPCHLRQRQYEIEHGLYSAYALCSEKDDKTVVICISQAKDDPNMAKQIFETFRWTD